MTSNSIPIIPNKPSHLSNKENGTNSINSSLPLNTVQPSNNSYQPKPNRQFNNKFRQNKRYRRPTPLLSIHHLTLYSSTSTANLIQKEANISPVSSYHDKNSAPSFPSNGTINNSKQSSSLYNEHVSPTSTTTIHDDQNKHNYIDKEKRSISNTNIKQSNNMENKNKNSKLNPGYFEIKPLSKDNYSSPSFIPESTQFYPTTAKSTTQNTKSSFTIFEKNNKYDGILAQLIDMGFDTNKAREAIEKSEDKTLQGVLDSLIQPNNNDIQNNTSANGFQKSRSKFESTKPTSFVPTNSNNTYKNTSSSPSSYMRSQTSFTKSTTNPPKPLRKSKGQNNTENDSSDDDILTDGSEWERQQEMRRRNYLESLKKQKQNNESPSYATKPVPSKPTSSPTHIVQENNDIHTIDADAIKKVIIARDRGNELYRLGFYKDAEQSYSQALSILPQMHDLSVIFSNNRAAARLKNKQYHQCLIDCNFVIERARDRYHNQGKVKDKKIVSDGGIDFQWYDQLVKALHRKANVLVATTRLKEAQKVYEELLDLDANDNKAKQGLKECQSSSSSTPSGPSSNNKNNNFNSNLFNNNTFNKSNNNNTFNNVFNNTNTNTNNNNNNNNNKNNNNNNSNNNTSAFPNLDYSIFEPNNSNSGEPPSKAVKEMRERQAKLAKEDAERVEKADVVDIRINNWKNGKEKNLRALLSTLDTVLWSNLQWKVTSVNELLEPRKVKICYMKAIAKVHPDKLPSTSTVEQKLLASGVFTVLNQAWDDFKTNNKL